VNSIIQYPLLHIEHGKIIVHQPPSLRFKKSEPLIYNASWNRIERYQNATPFPLAMLALSESCLSTGIKPVYGFFLSVSPALN